ncbi:MAG: AGE family epimerase/isomerase [Clostridiales bacterium]|nr:AGE family epimerase/isomerase [Clostridiales bacterium]
MARYNACYESLESALKKHLFNVIVPFWLSMQDSKSGGFYGLRTCDGLVVTESDKGSILNSRILWFFSNCCTLIDSGLIGDADISGTGYSYHDLKQAACSAYEFLRNSFLDRDLGGLYWSVSSDGRVSDPTKHTYGQAFAIYGLAAYFEVTGDPEARSLAFELFDIIEGKMRDPDGYLESFDRNFNPEINDKLSENGVIADRTMNTLLHVMEAYTELYRVTGDKRVGDALKQCLKIHIEHIWDEETERQKVFMDKDYNSIIDLYSYGHDMETSWLLDRTLEILDDPQITSGYGDITHRMLKHVWHDAYDGSLANECENGVIDHRRVWWVQAETVIGFVNEYMKTGDEAALNNAVRTWEFIDKNIVMKTYPFEWYSEVDHSGNPDTMLPVADEWKCPYHNGRMCMEIIRRGARLNDPL